MALISVSELRIGYRGPVLLNDVSCQIEAGQRIGLLGRNGSGKTTFMRILSGHVEPDGGEVSFSPGTTVALLPQDVPAGTGGSIRDVVRAGLPHDKDDHETAWQAEQRVDHLLASMNLPAEADFSVLSSGMKRRVLLARAIGAS